MTQVKAKVAIVGKRPLLFHKFTVDTISLERKEKTGVAGNDPEEWKRTVSFTKERQLYMDPTYVFGSLRDAAKLTKVSKTSLQKPLVSTLEVLDNLVLLDQYLPEEKDITSSPEDPVYIDVRGVKNPGTKGRNVRYRVAAAPGWKTTFEIQWDNSIVSREQMKAILADAGSFVGIGDGRGIGMGRFNVESFEEMPIS